MRGLTKRSRDKENNESSIRLVAKERQEIFQLKIRSASVGFLIPYERKIKIWRVNVTKKNTEQLKSLDVLQNVYIENSKEKKARRVNKEKRV